MTCVALPLFLLLAECELQNKNKWLQYVEALHVVLSQKYGTSLPPFYVALIPKSYSDHSSCNYYWLLFYHIIRSSFLIH